MVVIDDAYVRIPPIAAHAVWHPIVIIRIAVEAPIAAVIAHAGVGIAGTHGVIAERLILVQISLIAGIAAAAPEDRQASCRGSAQNLLPEFQDGLPLPMKERRE